MFLVSTNQSAVSVNMNLVTDSRVAPPKEKKNHCDQEGSLFLSFKADNHSFSISNELLCDCCYFCIHDVQTMFRNSKSNGLHFVTVCFFFLSVVFFFFLFLFMKHFITNILCFNLENNTHMLTSVSV